MIRMLLRLKGSGVTFTPFRSWLGSDSAQSGRSIAGLVRPGPLRLFADAAACLLEVDAAAEAVAEEVDAIYAARHVVDRDSCCGRWDFFCDADADVIGKCSHFSPYGEVVLHAGNMKDQQGCRRQKLRFSV